MCSIPSRATSVAPSTRRAGRGVGLAPSWGPDLDGAKQAEPAHPDRRCGGIGDVRCRRDLLAAEQGEPADVELDAFGDDHVDVPERCDGGDGDLAGRQGGRAEVDVDIAEPRPRAEPTLGGPETRSGDVAEDAHDEPAV